MNNCAKTSSRCFVSFFRRYNIVRAIFERYPQFLEVSTHNTLRTAFWKYYLQTEKQTTLTFLWEQVSTGEVSKNTTRTFYFYFKNKKTLVNNETDLFFFPKVCVKIKYLQAVQTVCRIVKLWSYIRWDSIVLFTLLCNFNRVLQTNI